MGALMKKFRGMFGDEFTAWRGQTMQVHKAFEYLTKYAYKPWSPSFDNNLIDGRTFYWLKEYLWSVEQSYGSGSKLRGDGKKPSVYLPATWVSNHTVERETARQGVSMPLHVQNVDMTVASNVLAGVTLSLLADPASDLTDTTLEDKICEDPSSAADASALPSWFNSELQTLYTSTADLMAWAMRDVNAPVFTRPDIVLLYYPSVYNFMWMASRTYFQLNSLAASKCGLPPALQHSLDALRVVFEGTVTEWLLKEKQTQIAKGVFKKTVTFGFWDDFLGNGDQHFDGQPSEKHQDRLFSTSQALNILLNVYAVHDKKTDSLRLLDSTTVSVRESLQQGITFIRAHASPNSWGVLRKYDTQNAFFSGSFKGPSSFSFVYPTNFARFTNGSFFDAPHEAPGSRANWPYTGATFGVSGIIPKSKYEEMMQLKWFGYDVPTEFKGFNHKDNRGFPFWSSPAFTYSTCLLALSKYRHIEKTNVQGLGMGGGVQEVVFE
eukprot:GDKI01001729.1.p1 GENE.GDKI01001729.1~~GDKI01001729.1.p1  ORF type:complete len:493 (+),score=185.39 GDKI01001729.1:262-1740(+)